MQIVYVVTVNGLQNSQQKTVAAFKHFVRLGLARDSDQYSLLRGKREDQEKGEKVEVFRKGR